MRADNSAALAQSARHRHELTRAKAIRAIRELDRAGTPVTFEQVARSAGLPVLALLPARHPRPAPAAAHQQPPCTRTSHPRQPASLRRITLPAPASRDPAGPAARAGKPAAAPRARPGPRPAANTRPSHYPVTTSAAHRAGQPPRRRLNDSVSDTTTQLTAPPQPAAPDNL